MAAIDLPIFIQIYQNFSPTAIHIATIYPIGIGIHIKNRQSGSRSSNGSSLQCGHSGNQQAFGSTLYIENCRVMCFLSAIVDGYTLSLQQTGAQHHENENESFHCIAFLITKANVNDPFQECQCCLAGGHLGLLSGKTGVLYHSNGSFNDITKERKMNFVKIELMHIGANVQ